MIGFVGCFFLSENELAKKNEITSQLKFQKTINFEKDFFTDE